MKFTGFIAGTALLITTVFSTAESKAQQKDKRDWQDRIRAEKIAFITAELELSPKEAEVFWPVYNQIDAEKKAAQKKVREAYKALSKALNEGTASEKEINRILDEYLDAQQDKYDNSDEDADRLRKVLPGEKVAKLYIAEENFRRHHIRNLGGNKGHAPKQQGHPARHQDRKPGPKK